MSKKNCTEHPDHSPQINRLNRASGQLEGIKKMIGEQKYCPEIITQLQALRSAIKAVEANILKSHLESCVREAFEKDSGVQSETKIAELVNLFKKNSNT